MLIFPRSRFCFNFFFKVTWTGKELKIAKLSQILNQLGVEEASTLDDFVLFFFENQGWELDEPVQIFSRVVTVIWRRQPVYSCFFVKPITLDTIIKYELDFLKNLKVTSWFGRLYKKVGGEIKVREIMKNLAEAGLSTSLWSSEFGYRRNLLNFKTNIYEVNGTKQTYLNREIMLGRKVNFRRKVKKKKFEEY